MTLSNTLLEYQEIFFPLIWKKDQPLTLYDSQGYEYVYRKGDRVIYPKALEWWEAMHEYKATLWGGAGGSGKSHNGRNLIAAYLTEAAEQGHPYARGVIFCKTYKDLEDRHIKPIVEKGLWSQFGKYKAGDNTFYADEDVGGWSVCFRNTENYEKYRSVEYITGFLDESTEHDEQFFNFILTRLRWATNGEYNEHTPLILATNPAGPGVAWNKRRFVDPESRDKKYYDEELKVWRKGFHYIPALPTDNPAISPETLVEMKNKPGKLRDAYFYGLWTVMEGQFFDLDDEVHFMNPFPIPANWNLTFAIDYGYAHPCHAVVIAVDPVNGDAYVIDEFSEVRWTPSQCKEAILQKFVDKNGKPYRYALAVGDPKMWTTDGSTDLNKTPAEIFNNSEDGLGSLNLVPADNSRVPGWLAMRELFHYEHEEVVDEFGNKKRIARTSPKLRIFRNCMLTYKSIMFCQHAKTNNEDVEKTKGSYPPGEGDDGADAVRYGIMAAVQGSFRDTGPHIIATPNETKLIKPARGLVDPRGNPFGGSTWAD